MDRAKRNASLSRRQSKRNRRLSRVRAGKDREGVPDPQEDLWDGTGEICGTPQEREVQSRRKPMVALY